MKKIIFVLVFLLTISGVLLIITLNADSSKPAESERDILPSVEEGQLIRQPLNGGVDHQNAHAAADYFHSCLSTDDNFQYLYPDTYGGCYFDDDQNFVIQVTTSDLSEYQFIQEAFPCIIFKQVKYSYNYLRNTLNEYLNTYDPESETHYSAGVDVFNNRARIEVDEKTLSQKTNDPDSPIMFVKGSPHYAL